MKSKYWAILLAVVLAICVGLSIFLLMPGEAATHAEIWSDGELKCTVALSEGQTITVESGGGVNVVTVKDGKIAVTQANCPDGYCMDRGFCSSGPQIVCLPNRLVIRFTGEQTIDGVVG